MSLADSVFKVKTRRCARCKKYRILAQFRSNGVSGLRSYCRKCENAQRYDWYHTKGGADWHKQWRAKNPDKLARAERRHNLKKAYGLTIDDYNLLLDKQQKRCALCRRLQSQFKKRFAVDHDHTTNKNRGLLCQDCNTGLGLLQDNPRLLRKAAEYIKEYR